MGRDHGEGTGNYGRDAEALHSGRSGGGRLGTAEGGGGYCANPAFVVGQSQAETEKLHGEKNVACIAAKAELKKNEDRWNQARPEYFARGYASEAVHVSTDGVASGLISFLEVMEADFSKSCAQTTAE